MHNTRALVLALALLGAGSAAISAPADDKVKEAFKEWNAAFNRGDAKQIASFYTADALLLPASHDIVKSPPEIEKFFAGLFSNHVTGHSLEPFKVIDNGETLVVASKWSAHAVNDKGAAMDVGGIATHVFQKQADSSYKLTLHTFN